VNGGAVGQMKASGYLDGPDCLRRGHRSQGEGRGIGSG
jgi:hypothetical protein